MQKTCPKCKLTAEPTRENWQRDAGNPSGWKSHCKKCRNAKQAAYQQRNAARNQVVAPIQFAEKIIHDANDRNDRLRMHAGELPEFEIDVVEPPAQTKEQLKVAKLEGELRSTKAKAKELERLALSGEAVRELVGSLGAPETPQPEWMLGASSPKSVTGTAVLALSDIHAGEVVRREQVGGCNAYDMAIMESRLKNTFFSTTRLLKAFMARPQYDGIVVALGGDLCSGNIHEELTETNEMPIQQVMLALEKILIEGLGGLVDEFGKLHVPCVTGNHGRMHKKPRAKNRAFENYEWLIYQRLKAYFASDSRVTFDIPEGPDTYFQVYKHKFGLTHGDQFRGGDGIGGIMVPIMRGISKKQVRDQARGAGACDTWIIGHWHQYIHTRQLIVNGSTKGTDEWTFQMNFPYQPPEQACFIVHPELGVTFRMPVQCDHNRKAA